MAQDDNLRARIRALIEDLGSLSAYRGRRRRLDAHPDLCTPQLAGALAAHAHATMRRSPLQAAQFARLGRVVAERTHHVPARIEALRALGQARLVQGRWHESLRALTAARELASREAGAGLGLAELDALTMQPLVHLERFDEARRAGARAIERFEAEDDRNGRIRVHMALGDLAFRCDRHREALSHYASVERLVDGRTPRRLLGILAANRANALEARHRFRAAERQFAIARRIFLEEGLEHTAAQVDYNAAYADALRGRYQAALRGYARSEDAFRRLDDARHLGLIDLERAEIHLRLNLPAEAARLARSAFTRFQALGMRKEQAQANHVAGVAASLLSRESEAAALFESAEAGFAALGLAGRRISCLIARSRLLPSPRARALLDEAQSLATADTDPLTLAGIELARARLEIDAHEETRALHRLDTALVRCRRIHAPWLRMELHRQMGRAYARRDQLEEAVLAYKHAIDVLEGYRGNVPPDEYMAAFLSARADLYAEAVEVLHRAGLVEQAFECTERAKSRALVDLLANRQDGATRRKASSLPEHRLRALRERLHAAYQRLFRIDAAGAGDRRSARAARATRLLASRLESELARLARVRRLRDRAAASLETVDAPDLAAVRASLPADTALLEYLVTPRALFCFLVTGDRFHAVRQDIPDSSLRRLLERFRFHLSKFDRRDAVPGDLVLAATRANLKKLADLLLGPVADRLEVRRLVVVPHGFLHGLPFHALPWGRDGWVADRFEVVYAPSAAVYGFCERARPAAQGRDVVFGVPDGIAPEIEREARTVARLLGSDRLVLGSEASHARFLQEAKHARLLHMATHGMFRREAPMLSSIRLANRWLTLYDLYDLRLDAELVVLSTCESGTADVTDGDEVLGLTRGFLHAGTRALLASQWRVHDETTANLMECFYRRYADGGDAAIALKDAMADIRAVRPHPYYWAPFFLTGRPLRQNRRAREAQAETCLATT